MQTRELIATLDDARHLVPALDNRVKGATIRLWLEELVQRIDAQDAEGARTALGGARAALSGSGMDHVVTTALRLLLQRAEGHIDRVELRRKAV